jgi:hypothetical protein
MAVIIVDLDRLQSTLLVSGLAQSNNALYQVINQLINSARQMQSIINTRITVIDTLVADATFLTYSSEISELPNSRELIAGTDITFDESVPGEFIINSVGISAPKVATRVSVRV